MIRTYLILCLCVVSGRVFSSQLLQNGSFEAVVDGGAAKWTVPSYWSGEVHVVTDDTQAKSGRRFLQLTTGQSRGTWWGRVLQSRAAKTSLGRPCRYSMWVRGRGEFLLGVIRYTKKVPGQPHYHYLWQEKPTTLTEQWQEITLNFTVMEARFLSLAFVAEVRGEGASACVDQAVAEYVIAPGTAVIAVPEHPMVVAGGKTEVHFRVLMADGSPGQGAVTIITTPPEGDAVIQTQDLVDGIVRVPFTAPLDGDDLWHLSFVHSVTGGARDVYVDVLPREQFAEFSQVAEKLPAVEEKEHILIIGDSLTDFHRGSNYVDKIGFWLGEANPGRTTVKNAGVGGDFITRVWDRLNGKKGTHRLSMYDGLFEPTPDRIVIFLGHNDSKVSSSSDYTQHCVSPEDFSEFFKKTIELLRSKTGASVTVMSATSSVYEITKAGADKRTAEGRKHSLFGKPEHLELFNTRARQVADELGCRFLDVYEPTRDHPAKASLFMADGVHVNNRGNRLLALLLLGHLAH